MIEVTKMFVYSKLLEKVTFVDGFTLAAIRHIPAGHF